MYLSIFCECGSFDPRSGRRVKFNRRYNRVMITWIGSIPTRLGNDLGHLDMIRSRTKENPVDMTIAYTFTFFLWPEGSLPSMIGIRYGANSVLGFDPGIGQVRPQGRGQNRIWTQVSIGIKISHELFRRR